MRILIAVLFAAACWGQTQVAYPTQIKQGPLYVSPTIAGLPTVCSAATPLWVVVNTIYQNQATAPACNWVSTGGSIVGMVNRIAKFTSSQNLGSSGITDDGTTVSTTEAVDFSGATQTLPATVYPTLGSFPSTGCKPGQLAINLSAGLGQQVYANSGTGSCSWTQQAGVGTATIAVTTNVIVGDGAGNGADSGIPPGNLIVSTVTYSNPGWLASLADTKIAFSDNTTGNASTSAHGYLPKLSGVTTQFLSGAGTWLTPAGGGGGGGTIPNTTNILKGDGAGNAADSGIGAANVIVSTGSYTNPSWLLGLAESKISFTNITTGNVNTSTHGFAPKLPNDATKYLDGTGAYSVPAGSAAGTVTSAGMSVPAWLTVAGSPITTSGTFAVTAAPGQGSHQVVGTCGSGTTFAPCDLVAGDLPLIPESGLSISNNTTANATTSAHGFVPLLPNDATKFFNGVGTYTVPPGQSGGVVTYSTNSSTYTTSTADSGKMIVFTGLSQALQLVNVGSSPTWWIVVRAQSTSNASLQINAPAGGSIDGTSNLYVPPGQGTVLFASTATAYYSDPGLAPTGVFAQPAAGTFTLTTANAGQLISQGCASACTVNMPTSFPVTPYSVFIQSTGAGTVSVSGNGVNIDGSAGSIPLTTGQGVYISSNGSAWYSFRGLGSGSSGVTSVGQTVPSWLQVSGSPITTAGTLAITSATGLTSHQVIGTCGSATTVSLCSLVAADLPAITSGSAVQKGNGSGGLTAAGYADIVSLFLTCSGSQYLGADGACHNATGGSGTVTSVAVTVPSWLTTSGSPVTTSGTIGITAATGQTAHQVIGTCGSATSVAPCSLTTSDLPALTTGSAIQKASSGLLTAALSSDVVALFSTCSGTQYLGADGACHSAGGTGTVTSVALSAPAELTVSGSPVTGTGTLTLTKATQSANQGWFGPASGSAAAPTFRAMVAADVPSNLRVRSIGVAFGIKGGSVLVPGEVIYQSVPFSCTISAWTAMLDSGGTVTFDIWKVAAGGNVPTISNTITASALPAISTGTAKQSTTLTGWTTSVAANDLFGFQVNAVAFATTATIQLECDQ